MACHHHTPRLATTEEAVIVLFCLIDDAYARLNPRTRRYESLKSASGTPRGYYPRLGVQQLRGVERANAPSSCATPPASSPTCSPGWSASRPPRCTAASASFAVLPPGALAAGRGGRAGRRARDADRRLSTLLSVLRPPGRSSSRRASKARRGGEVGLLLLGLRREALHLRFAPPIGSRSPTTSSPPPTSPK
jgi:hypothetical protein